MAARENRFRFVSYKEDIKNKVVISLKSVNYLDDNEELDSYFSASVERWSSSNSSPEIAGFRSRIAQYSLSLKLVHLNQKLIVNELLSFLRSTSALACTPFLDLVSSLCCDLREDFLPYLNDFLPEIFRLISTHSKNGDVLHPSFNCLSHMAYFLHRSLSRDVTNTLKMFSPVLKSTANHIAEFGAEILAFILRKVCDRHDLLQSLLQVFGDNYSLIGILMSEVLCGSVGKLHTSAQEILPIMFDLACCTHKSSTSGIRKGIRTLLKGERRSEPPDQSSRKIEAKAVSAVLRETLGRLLGSLHAGEVTYVIGLLNSRLQRMDNSEELMEPFKEAVSILSVLISCSPKEYATSTEVAIGTCFSKALSFSPTEEILTVFTKFLLESIQRYNPFDQIRLVCHILLQ
ncbi:hypothetical protein FBUS_11072 [Fasciolopsis buskii]|uniref:ARM repeat superfamily protein n=1 Tax=Fasciolopsis buskii TaxID=27845 RepID=A0A8E0RT68_9TREM|nr:hypothetical protein FBUS_11072 [Fasciolopsis buski]